MLVAPRVRAHMGHSSAINPGVSPACQDGVGDPSVTTRDVGRALVQERQRWARAFGLRSSSCLTKRLVQRLPALQVLKAFAAAPIGVNPPTDATEHEHRADNDERLAHYASLIVAAMSSVGVNGERRATARARQALQASSESKRRSRSPLGRTCPESISRHRDTAAVSHIWRTTTGAALIMPCPVCGPCRKPGSRCAVRGTLRSIARSHDHAKFRAT
jgi:hypothetical protein